MVSCRIKTKCLLMGPGPTGGNALRGGLCKRSLPLFTRISEKTAEKSEWLGRQAQPGFELGTSYLPVWAQNLSATGGTIPFKNIMNKLVTSKVVVKAVQDISNIFPCFSWKYLINPILINIQLMHFIVPHLFMHVFSIHLVLFNVIFILNFVW